MNRTLWTASLALAAAALMSAASSAATFTDNFATSVNYGTGVIGSFWSGTHNMGNLGAGGVFASSPASDPGLLVVDFDTNAGWEGTRSNAPFLFVNVSGQDDFVAEVSIVSQTSGQWSDAGIIARAKQGTPPGTGADHADEHFVYLGSFRTNAAAPNTGTTLFKRIQAGAQVLDSQIAILPGDEPLPIRLRLVKSGATYTGFVSPDNGTTWQQQTTTTAPAGTALADANIPMEVGISFSNFSGTLLGAAKFDDFSIITTPIPEPATACLSVIALGGLILTARRRHA